MCNASNFQKDFSSLIDLITYFNTEDICREYLAAARWGDTVTCPHCDNLKCYTLKGKTKRYKCAKCRKQFSVKVGTIFEDSKIPLQKWFAAIYLITSHKKGISSIQLGKDIGVTQKTAWFILHRIRHTYGIDVENVEVSGEVEIDETYVGGKEKNKHKSKRVGGTQGRSTKTKTAVLGILEREGKVVALPVDDTKKKTIQPIMRDVVKEGSTVYTDTYRSYNGLSSDYDHQTVDHSADEYARGSIHVNTIEGFWSLFKRGIIGIYHFVSDKHLAKYVNEFAFRYNSRDLSEDQRFKLMLIGCEKRLTYKTLIDK